MSDLIVCRFYLKGGMMQMLRKLTEELEKQNRVLAIELFMKQIQLEMLYIELAHLTIDIPQNGGIVPEAE